MAGTGLVMFVGLLETEKRHRRWCGMDQLFCHAKQLLLCCCLDQSMLDVVDGCRHCHRMNGMSVLWCFLLSLVGTETM